MLWFSLSSFIGLPLVYAGAVERQVSPIKMVKGSLPGKPFREPEPAQTGRCRVRMGCGVQTVTYVSGPDPSEVAERVGFEPTIGYSPIHAFQACAFNRSAISPSRTGRKFSGYRPWLRRLE